MNALEISESSILPESSQIEEQTENIYETKTYKLNYKSLNAKDFVDDLDACVQAIYKILNTQRGKYLIYSSDYGIELDDLFGKSVKSAAAVLEERITNALLNDERIERLSDFSFSSDKKGELTVKFTAHTVYGEESILKNFNFEGGGSDV